MSKHPHTPLPWECKRSPKPINGEYDYAVFPKSNPGVVIECFGRIEEDRTENAEANAAYIVKACNAYPKLVEALEKISQLTGAVLSSYSDLGDGGAIIRTRSIALAALSTVEDEQ